MVIVKIELIESPDTLDSKPYKIVRVYDNGQKQLLTTKRFKTSAIRTALGEAENANVLLAIYGTRLRKTKQKLVRR